MGQGPLDVGADRGRWGGWKPVHVRLVRETMMFMRPPDKNDKAILALVLLLTASAAAELVSMSVLGPHTWSAVTPFIVVDLIWLVTVRNSLFSKEKFAESPVPVAVSVIALGVYTAVSMYGAGHFFLPAFLVATTCLAAATAGPLWDDLTQHTPPLVVTTGVTVLVLGAATLLGAAALLRTEATLTGVATALGAIASSLAGVALLRQTHTFLGATVLLFGGVFVLLGATVLQNGHTWIAIVILAVAVATMLGGITALREAHALFELAVLLTAATFVLLGAALTHNGNTVIELVLLVGGATTLLAGALLPRTGAHALRRGSTLNGLITVAAGVGLFSLGTVLLRDNNTLIGFAVLLGAIAALLTSLSTFLFTPASPTTTRPQRPSGTL